MKTVALADTAPSDAGDGNSINLSNEAPDDGKEITVREGAAVASMGIFTGVIASNRKTFRTQLQTYQFIYIPCCSISPNNSGVTYLIPYISS